MLGDLGEPLHPRHKFQKPNRDWRQSKSKRLSPGLEVTRRNFLRPKKRLQALRSVKLLHGSKAIFRFLVLPEDGCDQQDPARNCEERRHVVGVESLLGDDMLGNDIILLSNPSELQRGRSYSEFPSLKLDGVCGVSVDAQQYINTSLRTTQAEHVSFSGPLTGMAGDGKNCLLHNLAWVGKHAVPQLQHLSRQNSKTHAIEI